jgi:hypothetical protein
MDKKPRIMMALIAMAFLLLTFSCTVHRMTQEEAMKFYEKTERRISKGLNNEASEVGVQARPAMKQIRVITDIFVKRGGQCPGGYHGLVNNKTASKTDRHFTDVNTGIGGDVVGICAKMEELLVSSSGLISKSTPQKKPIAKKTHKLEAVPQKKQAAKKSIVKKTHKLEIIPQKKQAVKKQISLRVLTGITVSHWPNWNVKCPKGFVPAAGEGGGKLTMRAKNRCWRQGLCVRWTPLNRIKSHKEVEGLYISDLYLRFSNKPRDFGSGWQRAGLDIHRECGGAFVFLHALYKGLSPEYYYNTMSDVFNRYKGPLKGETEEQYLERVARDLAPKIYLHPGERFYPSSLEYYFPNVNLINYKGQKVAASVQKVPLRPTNFARKSSFPVHFLVSKQKLDHDSSINLAFFRGQNPSKVSVPVYTIFSKKSETITDIVYFLFYPYNRGKRACVGTYTKLGCIGGYSTFRNHVADWEHMTIRLEKNRPSKIFLAYHNKGKVFDKDSPNNQAIEFRGTHPIVYSAGGSHGLHEKPGSHKYREVGLPGFKEPLVDYTGKGVPWHTWENLKIYGIYRPSKWFRFRGEWTWLNYRGRWGNPHGRKKLDLRIVGEDVEYVLSDGPSFPKYAIDKPGLE